MATPDSLGDAPGDFLMPDLADLIWILLSVMVVNNFTLSYFLGLCPFFGVSGRVATALRMGAANIFVLMITSVAAWSSTPTSSRTHPTSG
jgi:Na+-transporting NADH:ubiquinone oxidoreductase subunit NqrD